MWDTLFALADLTVDGIKAVAGQFTSGSEDVDGPVVPSSEVTYLDEIAGHLAAIRAVLEDTRNLLQHQTSHNVVVNNTSVPPAAAAAIKYSAQAARSAVSALSEAFAVPGHASPVAAAEGPASDPKPGAGHPTTSSKVLRVAANGLRDWAAGEPCGSAQYFAHIAEQVDQIAEVRETVDYLRG